MACIYDNVIAVAPRNSGEPPGGGWIKGLSGNAEGGFQMQRERVAGDSAWWRDREGGLADIALEFQSDHTVGDLLQAVHVF